MTAEGNPHSTESLLAQPLRWVTEQTLRQPTGSLIAAVAAAAICVALAVNGLGFKTRRLDLLNPQSRYNQRWLAYLAEFGERDDALIVVQSRHPNAIPPAIDNLVRELEAQPGWFESVLCRRDVARLKPKALHFASLEDLQSLDRQVTQAASSARSRPNAALAPLATLGRQLEQTPAGPELELLTKQYLDLAVRLPAELERVALAANHDPYASQQFTAQLEGQFAPQYLTADEGRLGFVLLKLQGEGNEFARGSEAIARLRKAIDLVRPQHPQTWIGLTGMPIIEHDEMQASGQDSLYTSLLSLVLVFALFWAGYGGLRHSLLACAALLIGVAWSFGFVTVVVGHLNILSAAFGVILVGLGIDFGIHYVASYLRLRREGLPTEEALLQTAQDVGPGVVTGGVTTAAAFFMAGLTEFVGVAELGIVAGGGILMCLAAAILTLPPLILLSDHRLPVERLPHILPAGVPIRALSRWPRTVFGIAAAAVLLAAAGLGGLWYDHNLLHLQPEHLESAAIERDLFTRMDDSVWFAVSLCDSTTELRERKARFERLPSVAKTEEIVSALPPTGPEKVKLIARIHEDLTSLPAAPPDAAARVKPLVQELARGAQQLESRNALQAAAVVQEVGRQLGHAGAQTPSRALLAGWQELQALRAISDPTPPQLTDLPVELTSRYVGKHRKHLLKVFARGNIWDMDKLQQFVAEVESVDPIVTGHPVQTFYASRHMLRSYLHAGVYALIAVFALLYLDFQSVRLSLLAMLPLAVGCLITAGAIGWLGIPLNPANMIVLPLLLGIGVDDGVHLVHEYRRAHGRFEVNDSTVVAVILTSTTTMVSFGTMILAQHRGLVSLGQVLTLGVLACLVASILFFPAVLAWLSRSRVTIPETRNDAELWVVPLHAKSA